MGREGKCVKVLDAAACFALPFLPGWVYILIPVLTWALLTAGETGLAGGCDRHLLSPQQSAKKQQPPSKSFAKAVLPYEKKSVCIHVHVRNHSGKRTLLTGIKYPAMAEILQLHSFLFIIMALFFFLSQLNIHS